MRLIKINKLSHAFPSKRLFHNASVMVCDNEHIALVGPNGCGKTTFLKILLGEFVPDVLEMERESGLRVGHLDQYAEIPGDITVLEYLEGVFADLYETEKRVGEIYSSLGGLDEESQIKAINRAERLNEYLVEKGFDRLRVKIENVLAGLGFGREDMEKNAGSLSGGQKTKLTLAKLLLEESDLLILDEPTNFLDIRYIEWLGDYLCRLKTSYIVISHDRAFIDKVSGKIIEIANGVFKEYNGDYAFYEKEKARFEGIQLQQHIAQKKYIEKAQGYVDSFFGKTIINSKGTWLKKMLQQLERIESPDEIIKPTFRFKHKKYTGTTVLSLDSLSVGYGGAAVLPRISLVLDRSEKIVLKGFNGIGKTTLLKTINGDLPAISGKYEYGEGVETVFLKQEEDYQNNFSSFNKTERKTMGIKRGRQREITAIEFAKEYYPEIPVSELQRHMFSCGLNEVHFYEQVHRLSGGEMTKLRLCLAMITPVSLIILDEPTNHIDVYSKEVLAHALAEFKGAVIMTTHDVNLETGWADRVINLEDLF